MFPKSKSNGRPKWPWMVLLAVGALAVARVLWPRLENTPAPSHAAATGDPPAPAPQQEAVAIAPLIVPGARVVRETVVQTAAGTGLQLEVRVPLRTKRAELEALMRQLYEQRKARPELSSLGDLSLFFAHFYLDDVDVETALVDWVGRVEKPNPEEEPSFANNLVEGTLVVAAQNALQLEQEVEEVDGALRITHALEEAVPEGDGSVVGVSDALLAALFSTASTLYAQVGRADRVVQRFAFKGRPVGEVALTRKAYRALSYEKRIAEAGRAADSHTGDAQVTPTQMEERVKEAERAVYRELLKQLPPEDVNINRAYRP